MESKVFSDCIEVLKAALPNSEKEVFHKILVKVMVDVLEESFPKDKSPKLTYPHWFQYNMDRKSGNYKITVKWFNSLL